MNDKLRRTVNILLSWLFFGICLMVVLGEILGFHMPAFAYRETQKVTVHHHSSVLDLQSIWDEMEYLYHVP